MQAVIGKGHRSIRCPFLFYAPCATFREQQPALMVDSYAATMCAAYNNSIGTIRTEKVIHAVLLLFIKC